MIKAKSTICLIFSIIITAHAQTERFLPDTLSRSDFWHITDSTELYVGASFFYMDPSDSIVVWFESSESQYTGDLYCMVPGLADSAIFLFTNRQYGARINLTNALNRPINPGTEFFFMYRSRNSSNNRYTGQNRVGIDPVNKITYPGANFVTREFGVRPGYGHRWSVAGRITDSAGLITDTIVFGFEDGSVGINPLFDSLVTSDFDFNDVIFKVTGLSLNVEPFPDSISLSIAQDSAGAGGLIFCKTQVWSDSAGFKIRSPQYDSLVMWSLSGINTLGDTLLPGDEPGTTLFSARTAFQQFNICASFAFRSDTLKTCKSVYVKPGKPEHLSLELIADTSLPGFSFNHSIQISRIMIPSNDTVKSIFAILRDAYGNYVKSSTSTNWDTSSESSLYELKAGIASIHSGNSITGEGVIKREQGIGDILVYAEGTSGNDTLCDTVLVNIISVSYDAVRIGIKENGVLKFNSKVIISTDDSLNLFSQGHRIDNGEWESIPVQWNSLTFLPDSIALQRSALQFCPDDTGSDTIKISFQQSLSSQLQVKVIPGVPAQLRLYTENQTPSPADTAVHAGNLIPFYARLLDKKGIWIGNQIPADSVVWELFEHDNINISDSSGHFSIINTTSAAYLPLRAYRTVTIKAAYNSFCDSVILTIGPGEPYRIVIESHANWRMTPNAPDEIDTIEIPDNRTSAVVYALIRDSLGNFVDSLRSGDWSCLDTIISVTSDQVHCKGTIHKNISTISGLSTVSVKSGDMADTAFVRLLPFHYIDLQITSEKFVKLKSIKMSTNEDTLLRARALRSDTAIWRSVAVNWFLSEGLNSFPAPGLNSSQFLFSPLSPGQGTIAARLPGSDELSDTITAVVTRGKPLSAEFIILTPGEQLIAGDTITTVVKIYNKDGLVPGEYCFSSDSTSGPTAFQDQLGYGTAGLTPFAASKENTAPINIYPSTDSGLKECFSDGIDTVKMVFYYAPFNKDSLHRASVKLGDIYAYSSSFHLRPSSLQTLTISHTHSCCPDSLALKFPSEQVLLYAMGFDKFENMRGSELSFWQTTGTLHQFDSVGAASRVLYSADSANVSSDESGFAIAVSPNDSTISDSLSITITGPRAGVLEAKTADVNGNGLLDKIKLYFNMPVFILSESLLSRLSIQFHNTVFPVDSLIISDDSLSMAIYLHEQNTPSLQTNWTPLIALDNTDYVLGGAKDSLAITASDGAGPVIVSVVKEISKNGRKNDFVTVTLSEAVLGPDGMQLSLLELPQRVFYTWNLNSSQKFSKLNLLNGIEHFSTPLKPNQLFFTTSNGKELTASHYFNLRTDKKGCVITDLSRNAPLSCNRKVKVDVHGTAQEQMLIYPNPSSPTLRKEKPGEFHIEHNPSAVQWVASDKAGFVLQFQLSLPEKGTFSVGGHISIIDISGNTVCSDPLIDYKWGNLLNSNAVVSNEQKKNLLPSSWIRNGSIYNYTIYWNGYNADGVKAAPGVYKAILRIFIKSGKKEQIQVYTGKIGVRP